MPICQLSVRDAAARIGDAVHCQAGGTIAVSAALAAALGQATANATLDSGATVNNATVAGDVQTRLHSARMRFLELADQDAGAITEFAGLRQRGEALRGYALLCDGPREIGDLAVDAAQTLQTFRAHVCERTRDDLEFAITLMTGAARAAMQLLDSNMRIWPQPELLATYQPHVARLVAAVGNLRPVVRIR